MPDVAEHISGEFCNHLRESKTNGGKLMQKPNSFGPPLRIVMIGRAAVSYTLKDYAVSCPTDETPSSFIRAT